MHIFYRISTAGHQKPKVPGITKELCLENTLKAFPKANFTLIFDHCAVGVVEACRKLVDRTHVFCETTLGNSGSFRKALEMASTCSGIVYFLEDDYLHKPGVDLQPIVEEGLKEADYVTLYDHPDKYGSMYDYGEVTKIVRKSLSHWKYTVSTTMTFATTAEKLREDHPIWLKFTEYSVPHDHECFSALTCSKARRLLSALPGLAVHTDLTDGHPDADPEQCRVEPWVFDMMQTHLFNLLGEEHQFGYDETPLKRLMILQSMLDLRNQHVPGKAP